MAKLYRKSKIISKFQELRRFEKKISNKTAITIDAIINKFLSPTISIGHSPAKRNGIYELSMAIDIEIVRKAIILL